MIDCFFFLYWRSKSVIITLLQIPIYDFFPIVDVRESSYYQLFVGFSTSYPFRRFVYFPTNKCVRFHEHMILFLYTFVYFYVTLEIVKNINRNLSNRILLIEYVFVGYNFNTSLSSLVLKSF